MRRGKTRQHGVHSGGNAGLLRRGFCALHIRRASMALGAQRDIMADELPQARARRTGARTVMRGMSRRRFLAALGFSGAGVVGLSGYALAIEPGYRLNVTRYRVSPPNWTPGLNLTVGVIADVHAGGPLMPAARI